MFLRNHVLLGPGWAGNTANTAIFRHHGVLTVGRFQFCAYYTGRQQICIVQRDLLSGVVFKGFIDGDFNIDDAHNSISVGCDRDGHLHLAYAHHSSALRYRRTLAPLDVKSWSDEVPMTGEHEERVTYPAFLIQGDGRPLLFLYRDGVWNSGSARIKEFSETSGRWTDRDTPVLSGAGDRPWSGNAYWNHPALARDGSIHLSYVWRTLPLGPEKRVNNINVSYAYSRDQGRTWQSSRRRKFRLPITPVNGETVFPVSPGSNLVNQCSMSTDSQDRPHIVFYSDDPDGVPQYQHVWFDGRQWRHNIVSARTEPFVLSGGGTLTIPISRPEIVIDDDDRVYVIYLGDLTRGRMVAQRLLPPDYEPISDGIHTLWDAPLGHAEPIVDRLRWQRDRVLSMLIQKNDQPAHDAPAKTLHEPVYLVDWSLA